MADYDLPLKKPGLGLLLLNGAGLTLLNSTIANFDKSAGSWTRIAIICFGAGVMASVLTLFVEAILPEKVFVGRGADSAGAKLEALKRSEEAILKVKRPQYWAIVNAGFALASVVAQVTLQSAWLRIFPLIFFGLAIWSTIQIDIGLRKTSDTYERDQLAEVPPDRPASGGIVYEFETSRLGLLRYLLGFGLGFFVLGVISAVNQPFAASVACVSAKEMPGMACGDKQPTAEPRSDSASFYLRMSDRAPESDEQKQRPVEPQPPLASQPITSDILFAFDSATLGDDAKTSLEPFAKRIRAEWKSGPVLIAGHADGIGRSAYNVPLSARRATAVVDWLVHEGGLGDIPFRTVGRGSSEPRRRERTEDGQDDRQARQLNRRVVAIILN